MALLPENVKEDLKKVFEKNMKDPIDILVILDTVRNGEESNVAKKLMEELSQISNLIRYEIVDANENPNLLDEYDVNLDQWGMRKGPIFIFKQKPNIIYFGLPLGEEFTPFIEDIINVSKGEVELSKKAREIIETIDVPLKLLIFVTPPCPYCPMMTSASHKFAFINPKIKSIMVEATEFPELSNAYNVFAVPKNVIEHEGKEILAWEGAVPEEVFADQIIHALKHIKGEPHEH